MTQIHATAVIEPGAELGVDVAVEPFSIIHAGARIGDRCRLGPHVTVYERTVLGADCRVHACAVLGDRPQMLAFEDSDAELRIGARCVIRENVTLHRGVGEGTATEIGDDCFLMALSHCAHNVRLGKGVIVANGVLFAGYVTVGDRAFISGNVMVHQFCRIGRLAMISGGSGVSKDVPPFCTTHPLTLNRIAGLNTIGMRRAGLTHKQRLEIKRIYQMLYHDGLNVSQALEHIARTMDGDIAAEVRAFVGESRRGICTWKADPAMIE